MEEVDVVILGGGIAGLACARALAAKFTVCVVEARPRVGGRLHQEQLDSMHVEMGGTFLHGRESNVLHALAHDIGVETVFVDWDGDECPEHVVSMYKGCEVEGRQLEELDNMTEKLLSIIFNRKKRKKAVLGAGRELSSSAPLSLLQECLSEMVEENYRKKDVLAWIDREFFVKYVFYSCIACDYGHSVHRMSLLEFDQEEETVGGNHLLKPPGYSGIINHILNGSDQEDRLDVRLSHIVSQVRRQRDGRIVVVTKNGASLSSKAVVVTVPLGVLKARVIQFSPQLSDRKEEVLDRMLMSVLDKVFLQFDHVWWKGSAFLYENINESSGLFFSSFYDMHRVYGANSPAVLAAFVAGESALRLEDMEDEEIVKEAMKAIQDMWGSSTLEGHVPHPIRWKVTRWGKDEFSRGSYSVTPPGASFRDHDHLARPEWDGTLRFAGEATYREHPSTAHGAYLSGLREAKKLEKIFSSNQDVEHQRKVH